VENHKPIDIEEMIVNLLIRGDRMIRRYALWGRSAVIGTVLLMAMLTAMSSDAVAQQRPELPIVSLTGQQAGWERNIYPDGRIWVPRRGANGERILTVPVFIKNCWRTTEAFEAFPIYSFKMKLQFDSSALQFIGIEKNGPAVPPLNLPKPALAKDFFFETHVARDTTYQNVINSPIENRLRGKRVLITGTSGRPLPQTGDITTPCDQRPFVELFYVKFRVIANPGANPVSARTPLIMTNDTLMYNDFDIAREAPFPNDPPPGRYAGLGGIDNFFIDVNNQEQNRDVPRYSRFGMIWVEVTDEVPKLSFTNVSDPRFRLVDSVQGSNGATWFVTNPITIDSGVASQDNFDEATGLGVRDIDVINAVAGTRATDVVVQSDQPWLLFRTFTRGGGEGEVNPIPVFVREGYIPIIDKGILGTVLGVDPQGINTVLRRDIAFRIACDPRRLPLFGEKGNQELAGIYTGYITFKSSTIDIAPVRVKVTFIYFRPPFEPTAFEGDWQGAGPVTTPHGIQLEIRNSNNPIERTYLVMGVGSRATDGVDTLFGETLYQAPLNSFGARWYPMDSTGKDLVPNGLGDMWLKTFQGQRAASRDIRDIYTDSTLIFKCRFNAGSALNYPVVVSWNTDDFTPGSDLFIRDTVNGSRFNVNMREATDLGGGRFSYTIQDADINAFIIEYTLPRITSFPAIKKGWNLLSLPVNPSNAQYQSVFPNALNVPIAFVQNSYQQAEVMRPGLGYFVKFPEDETRIISGARLRRIDADNFRTRLQEGWNTIGSLSSPISTQSVVLDPFGTGGGIPEIRGDIYSYITDRGYQAVSTIEPGFGYFIKVSAQAILRMQLPAGSRKDGVDYSVVRNSITSASTRLTIADAGTKSTNLYVANGSLVEAGDIFELPPVPPANLFDARFVSNTYVDNAQEPIIRIQGVQFPVTLTATNAERSYDVFNAVTGQRLGTIQAGVKSDVVINDASATTLRLASVEAPAFAVAVNPNQIASAATVTYSTTQTGMVNVSVYNTVGEHVATLVNGTMAAGRYVANLDAAALPAGGYIVKLTNGGSVTTVPVTIVR
jgi:hypothetical protein